MQELGLTRVQNTECGSELRKRISGGERKRTAIGVELITDPSIIFLDEPTSGLDSFRATSIVALLEELAHNKGKTVIATIHQPNSLAFAKFDRLILMMDGFVAYQGTARDAVPYLTRCGYPLKKNYNPADHFMNVLAMNFPKQEADLAKIKLFQDNYATDLQ